MKKQIDKFKERNKKFALEQKAKKEQFHKRAKKAKAKQAREEEALRLRIAPQPSKDFVTAFTIKQKRKMKMERDEFKKFAAGSFVIDKPSVDVLEMSRFVEGALMAFDFNEKQKRKGKEAKNVDMDQKSIHS